MANLVVGLTWIAGLAGAVWLGTHDHPFVGFLVLCFAFSAHSKEQR